MFRVKTQRLGRERQVFTWEDPRKGGYMGEVEEGVTLDYDVEKIFLWPEGTDLPAPCLGRSRENAKRYEVFKYRHDLDAAGYEFVSSDAPLVFLSYRDFLDPPNPDETEEEAWYNVLDNVDDEARRLRQRSPWPENPRDASRDAVAEWLAKQHFITDPTSREIWYLPQGAPADEIRFLEISERLIGNEERVEPFDFGVDALGAHFRLLVGDISGDQLETIKRDPSVLPPGWRIDDHIIWRRRPR